MKQAIYPGSFDPLTYGHLDIIRRARRLVDLLVVAVAPNVDKKPLFTVQERVEMLRQATRHMRGVRVEQFGGLSVAFARKRKIHLLIRGLRAVSDFEYEFQMALTNRRFDETVETVFMMPSESYSFLSSKLIKEAVSLGADVKAFVPSFVQRRLREKLDGRR